ncbi:hypothetical protein CcaCcLH18_12854 [Colletotrichum camelliae]|nr:hypothetical protein CcaCcLH18_12854 [Colletotrichum camelliae]
MQSQDSVFAWISSLPRYPAEYLNHHESDTNTRKRKRKQPQTSPSHRLPSPPKSPNMDTTMHEYHDAEPAEDDTGADPDPDADADANANAQNNTNSSQPSAPLPDPNSTPRPPKQRRIMGTAASEPAVSDADTRSVTTTSSIASSAQSLGTSASRGKKRPRQPSPRKQKAVMSLEDAITSVSFGSEMDRPALLDELESRIELLAGGSGIVSPAHKNALLSQAQRSRQFSWVKNKSFARIPPLRAAQDSIPQSSRDRLGPTPTVDWVKEIWRQADDAEKMGHHEGQWNCAVHYPLLYAALRHFQQMGVCDCTTAQIHADYARFDKIAHHNKRVDFCAYVKDDSPELNATALASPFQSINHTEYPGLLQRPIALSVETKLTGHDWTQAQNQMAVWLLAQWDMLDDLTTRARGGVVVPRAGDDARRPRPSPAAATGLALLPGIIVQGHEWYFVAATRVADGKTNLWHKIPFGSTQTTEGIYKVFAVLQLLGHWIQETYWPWFQRVILRMA